jgi:hypothetical protein
MMLMPSLFSPSALNESARRLMISICKERRAKDLKGRGLVARQRKPKKGRYART